MRNKVFGPGLEMGTSEYEAGVLITSARGSVTIL
jgi:hypothetical protein